MPGAVRSSVKDAVSTITIDNPPVNALSAEVTRGLADAVKQALEDPTVRAIVVTGAGSAFVAGADITRLERIAAGERVAGGSPLGAIFEQLEAGPKPSVAAIDGVALGGGLELAMACNARVGTPRARIGLPELALGLIPGAGGTQRLPRLIGLAAALETMLEGRHTKADEALALGALDEIAPAEDLPTRARAIALEIADGVRPRRQSLRVADKLPGFEQAEELVARARANAAKRYRNVPHANECLDAVLAGIEDGPEAGLARERAAFERLLTSDSARGLIHVFFAERAAAKVPGVTDAGLEPRTIRRVLVLGGGTMGSGIATALIGAGIEVVLSEIDEPSATRARERVAGNVERNVARGRLSRSAADAMLGRLQTRAGWRDAGELELVIEAATENVALKSALFAELAQATPETTLLASNTSTIGIDVLASAAGAPERVLGTHFFSPAQVMKLVEIVRTEHTSPSAILDVLALCRRMQKTAVTVRSCTGFVVNRIFMPYGQATGFLIDRGVDPYRIDGALFDFGMPMGPCRMSDLAGIDVGVAAGAILDAAYPDRSYRSPLRRLLVEAGRLGEKSGSGHYVYRQGNAMEDPELGSLLLQARSAAGDPEPIELDDEELVFMILFGVVNEACRVIEEGVVIRASDIDVASILGMGFPAYRGGILGWADALGAARVHDALARWHERHGIGLFRPSEHLARAARNRRSLLA